jgi:hypothetical protein
MTDARHQRNGGRENSEPEYMGRLMAQDVIRYETRIEEITEDMEDLNVEEIKSQVLDTHFSPKSRPSSSASSAPMPNLLSYTWIDDFTAIVTATVLQALPNLSRLMRLMDVWSMRLTVLRKVPPLLLALDDVEVALESGWKALGVPGHHVSGQNGQALEFIDDGVLSRKTFQIMKDVLQDKVTTLGQDLDYMLDTLEGRQDTLPESWLDQMESIEQDYGEWVVAGDRKVREGEWARMAQARKEQQDALRLKEEEAADAAREQDALRLKEEEAAEAARQQAAKDAAEAEAAREQDALRLEEEEAAEAARQQDALRLKEEEAAEAARQQDALRLKEEEAAEAARQQAAKDAAEAEVARQREEASRQAVEPEKSEKLAPAEPADAVIPRESTFGDAEPEESIDNSSHPAGMNKALAVAEAPVSLAAGGLLTKSKGQSHSESPNIPDTENSLSPVLELALFDGSSREAKEPDVPETPTGIENLENQHDDQLAAQEIGGNDTGMPEADITPVAMQYDELPSTPKTPSPLPSFDVDRGPESSPNQTIDNGSSEEDSPRNSAKAPRFSHTVANMPRRSSSPQVSGEGYPSSRGPATKPSLSKVERGSEPTQNISSTVPLFSSPPPLDSTNTEIKEMLLPRTPPKQPIDEKRIAVDSAEDGDIPQDQASDLDSQTEQVDNHSDLDEHQATGDHSRNISLTSVYLTSEPTPVILQAEPTSYFRPMISPIKSAQSYTGSEEPTTPTKSPLTVSGAMTVEVPPSFSALRTPPKSPTAPEETDESDPYVDSEIIVPELSAIEEISVETSELDGAQESVLCGCETLDRGPSLARKASIIRISSGIKRIELSRRASTTSDTSTIITSLARDTAASTPYVASSPMLEKEPMDSFPEVDEQSPSAGRVGLRNNQSHDYSPPDSPPPIAAILKRRSLQLLQTPEYSQLEPTDVPPTPTLEAPLLENVDISEAPLLSSPKKSSTEQSTDDQIQQQISSILESIPARIRLTSEPDTEPSSNDSLQPKKTRRSITPSYRSHSSLSTHSRAPTPSFTLAPAYSKGASRPRPASGNPEIKLYHLSRSTGEAPIKLFVRLVGEHGERVMVRVGGGWADLGEYLKEYASHHGRRSVGGENDKVEIQDLPRRIISTSSSTSTSTIRGNGNGSGNGNGRSSPVSRPASAFDRPMSSLNVRKTRKSVGDSESSSSFRSSDLRNPSTPLPSSSTTIRKPPPNTFAVVETPPSTASTTNNSSVERSSSRLSWTEDDSSLGLAGPKSKKVVISERDQEWVESMKEKVRQASAEKERKTREGTKEDRRTSFGEMEKIGGTKRLFRKG